MFDYQFTRRYGVQYTFYFTLRQSSATNALPPEMTTGLTHAAGDTQISKDGAAFANTTNAFVALGLGVYSITLTATEMQATDIVVFGGGTIPPKDIPRLQEMGVAEVFTPGTPARQIVAAIDDCLLHHSVM